MGGRKGTEWEIRNGPTMENLCVGKASVVTCCAAPALSARVRIFVPSSTQQNSGKTLTHNCFQFSYSQNPKITFSCAKHAELSKNAATWRNPSIILVLARGAAQKRAFSLRNVRFCFSRERKIHDGVREAFSCLPGPFSTRREQRSPLRSPQGCRKTPGGSRATCALSAQR